MSDGGNPKAHGIPKRPAPEALKPLPEQLVDKLRTVATAPGVEGTITKADAQALLLRLGL